MSSPASSKVAFDSTVTVNEGNYPMQERQRGGIREILDQFVNETNPVYKYATLAEAMQQLNPIIWKKPWRYLNPYLSVLRACRSIGCFFMHGVNSTRMVPLIIANRGHREWEPGLQCQGFWKVGHHEVPGSTRMG